jgi:bifunctional non-homologous end joining protein LigD
VGGTSERGELRSLLAGVYRDGLLEYVGRIGTGYGEAVAKKVLPVLQKLTSDEAPSRQGRAAKESNVRWLKPELVAEIEFGGWSETG